jgi:hypothetical protein
MNKRSKLLATAGAIALLGAAGCSTISNGGSGQPAPQPKTPAQAAQVLIGSSVHNQITGQDLQETVKAAKPTGSFYKVPGGGRQFHAKVTTSDGTTSNGVITLWPDGSVSWRTTG